MVSDLKVFVTVCRDIPIVYGHLRNPSDAKI